MLRIFLIAAALLVATPLAAEPARSGNPVFDRTVDLVRERFYTADALPAFDQAVAIAVESMPNLAEADPDVVDDAIDFILASLDASHTARYTPDDIDYYELVDVFRHALRGNFRRLFRSGEVAYPGIGIATERIGGKVFVTDVYDGGPADRAGLLAGDEILTVNGMPFAEVAPFRERVGTEATLSVRRAAGAAPMDLRVAVERLTPSPDFVDAIEDSVAVIERDGLRIGHIRLWSYTEREVTGVIERAITGPLATADGLVLDLRSRWGGAPPDAADTFVGGAPDMVMTTRGEDPAIVHARWRKPLVAIIDEGTRSGMEVLAHALKSNGVRLIGTRTAGAVLGGRGFILPDDSLLVVAVADVLVDGQRLEGQGVVPDVEVPFDIRYAAGRDPQLDAAVADLAERQFMR